MFVFDFFSSIPYTLLRGLAVSNSGRFVVSSSHDRSIRIWEQTDEQIFLDVCLFRSLWINTYLLIAGGARKRP